MTNDTKTNDTKTDGTTRIEKNRRFASRMMKAGDLKLRSSEMERVAPAFAETVAPEEREGADRANAFLGRKTAIQPDLRAPIHVEHERIQQLSEDAEVSFNTASEWLHAAERRRRVVRHLDNTAKTIGLARLDAEIQRLLMVED